ncbi:N-acetylmuramoyl-L-alanine amidase [uncultured Allofournierella sp.]|uniref:N-acetylmuramoyl-L-alanine amidase family protein n=1 Tax=uncultured Allofournierella sp. TaxID=1940258 RepID=UPI0025D54FD5|nr:N-acetylmuramoyl-L-alanine amidase [uncultured Fournierella sp.]
MPTATLRRPRRRRRKRAPLLRLAAPILALVLLAGAFWIALARFSAQREDDPTKQARIVAIDAGHGGSDTGAIGVDGVRECDLTQATAQALWDLLEADPDIVPVMCRSDWDEDLPAADRAKRVARSDATLSLSIHMNSDGGSGQASGFECFPAPPGNQYNKNSLRFADFITAEMSAAGASLRGDGGVRYAYYDENDQRIIRERSDTNPEGYPSFAMVNSTGCASVLAEQCFITSESDLAAFASPEGCQLAARCYYRAIRQYYGLSPEPEESAS